MGATISLEGLIREADELRQSLVTGISHNGKQLIDATAADRCDNAKLGKSRPEI